MRECGLGIHNIMCDDIKFEDLNLTNLAGMDDITCDDQTYDDQHPDDCEKVVLGLMI